MHFMSTDSVPGTNDRGSFCPDPHPLSSREIQQGEGLGRMPEVIIQPPAFTCLQRDCLQFSQETSLRSLSHSMDRGQERAFDFWFNAFLLVYQLRYLTHDDHLRSYMTEMPGYELFDSMLCTIEIARGDVVEKVFFRKPMDAQYLTPEAKSELLETVDRSHTALPKGRLFALAARGIGITSSSCSWASIMFVTMRSVWIDTI